MKGEEIKDKNLEALAELISERILDKLEHYFSNKDVEKDDESSEKSDFLEEFEIDGVFEQNDCLWKEKSKGYYFNLKNEEYIQFYLRYFFENEKFLSNREYEKLKNDIAKDVQMILLNEAYCNIYHYIKNTENVDNQLQQEFFYEGQEGIEILYERLGIVDNTQAQDIKDKLSEELNLGWKIPKVLLPLYTYIYLQMRVDKRVLDVHKQDVTENNLGLKFIDKYPSSKSRKQLLNARSKVEDFYYILDENGIEEVNKSLNLSYFNRMTNLYDLELYTKQILKKDKLVQFNKSYDKGYYKILSNSKKFDRIKNLSLSYYSHSEDFMQGIQWNVFSSDLQKGANNLKEIEDESIKKMNSFLSFLCNGLKAYILKQNTLQTDFELPEDIEDDYFIYKKLAKIEFYEKFIKKITPAKLIALKENGSKKEIMFFDVYHSVYSTIYEYNKE